MGAGGHCAVTLVVAVAPDVTLLIGESSAALCLGGSIYLSHSEVIVTVWVPDSVSQGFCCALHGHHEGSPLGMYPCLVLFCFAHDPFMRLFASLASKLDCLAAGLYFRKRSSQLALHDACWNAPAGLAFLNPTDL